MSSNCVIRQNKVFKHNYLFYYKVLYLFSSLENMFFSSSFLGLSEELILVSNHFNRSSILASYIFPEKIVEKSLWVSEEMVIL